MKVPMTPKECRLVGRELENDVATRLRALGLQVYQNALVPYSSGATAEIDILAVSSNAIFNIECKNYRVPLVCDAESGHWSWNGNRSGYIYSPYAQCLKHEEALREQLGCPIISIVATADYTEYRGPECKMLMKISALIPYVQEMMKLTFVNDQTMARSLPLLNVWGNPTPEQVRKHVLDVNARRNRDTAKVFEQRFGVDAYCLCVEKGKDLYYYFYTDDDDVAYGTEKLAEATLFRTEEEARVTQWELGFGKVCTLQWGYLEDVDELPDETEDMTPAEYAHMVGARPW